MKISNSKFQIQKLQSLLFYLLILFLPTQLGRHFWPDFSFINGIRVDYLSPTFYLTDFLLVLLIIFYLLNKIFNEKRIRNLKFQILNFKLGFLMLFLLVGIVFSKNPESGIYGLIKFFEFTFFGFYTARFMVNKERLNKVVFLFSIAIVFESILAMLQFFQQGSLNGIFYLFGERMFNAQTPGIANAVVNNELTLRPYATFSHPNVLAGYLLIGMTLIISKIKDQRSKLKKVFFLIVIVLGTTALFLTLSRIAIFTWLLILILIGLNQLKKRLAKKEILVFCSVLIILLFFGILFSPLHARFTKINFLDESILIRKDLIEKSILMIKDHPIFGVGLNNYLINLTNYQKVGEYSMINFLQPVHNIYLLIAVETGMIGLILFLWFVFKTFFKSKNNNRLLILTTVLLLGFFDHYFLTLQQGQFLLAFVFGFCWASFKN